MQSNLRVSVRIVCEQGRVLVRATADDTGGRRRRRVAGDRSRAVERLQPRRFRHALLPLHRWHGHSALPKGPHLIFSPI